MAEMMVRTIAKRAQRTILSCSYEVNELAGNSTCLAVREDIYQHGSRPGERSRACPLTGTVGRQRLSHPNVLSGAAYDRDAGARDVMETVRTAVELPELTGKVALQGYCLGALMQEAAT